MIRNITKGITMNKILTPYDMNIVNNAEPYGNVSDRYIPTSTQELIAEIGQYKQMQAIDFSSANVRKAEKQGKQKHVIMLQGDNSELLDGTNLRVVLFNSLDKSSAIKLYIGAYRAICNNGMVFGDDIMEPMTIRHTKQDWKHSIKTLMDTYEDVQESTHNMIDRMMHSHMSYGDIGRLTERVAEEFNPQITGTILDPMQLNTAHRTEDVGKNAWLTYQRIQYNLLQGGVDRVIGRETDEGVLFDTVSKTHKVTDNAKQINFNRRLHDLVLENIR